MKSRETGHVDVEWDAVDQEKLRVYSNECMGKKQEETENVLQLENYDLIVITETWWGWITQLEYYDSVTSFL